MSHTVIEYDPASPEDYEKALKLARECRVNTAVVIPRHGPARTGTEPLLDADGKVVASAFAAQHRCGHVQVVLGWADGERRKHQQAAILQNADCETCAAGKLFRGMAGLLPANHR